MGADGRFFVLYDYENRRICQFSLHRSRTSCPSGQLARSKSAERCGSPVATSKGHWPFEAPTEPTGETSSLQGARMKPLPSDMMLCVISYWVYIIWRKTAADPAAPLLRSLPANC